MKAIVAILKCGLIGLLIYSCSPLRHYKKVAGDTFRNSAERALLARAAQQEFPAIQDTGRVVYVGIDSSEYNKLNFAYLTALDSLIAHAEREDTTETPENTNIGSVGTIGRADSLRIVRGVVKSYKPPAIVKTEVKEVKVRDGVWAEIKQQEIDACKRENNSLLLQRDEAVAKKKSARTTQTWLWVVVALLGAWKTFDIVNSFKRVV